MTKPRVIALAVSALTVLWLVSGVSSTSLEVSSMGSGTTIFVAGAPSSILLWLLALALYIWTSLLQRPTPEEPPIPASLKQRFVAFFLDFLVCWVIAGVPTVLLVLGAEAMVRGTFAWEIESVETLQGVGCIAAVAPLLLVSLLSWPVSKQKLSPGMLVCGFYVYSPSPMTFRRAVLRTIMGFLTLASLILSLPMALSRADRRMWHDLAAGTYPRWAEVK